MSYKSAANRRRTFQLQVFRYGVGVCILLGAFAIYFYLFSFSPASTPSQDIKKPPITKHVAPLVNEIVKQRITVENDLQFLISLNPDGYAYEETRDILSFGVRPVGSVGIRGVREHIVNTLNELDWKVELDSFVTSTPSGELEFVNIIATYCPMMEKRVVYAAHYDSKVFNPNTFVGATDSAAPCGMLLDIARAVSEYNSASEELCSRITSGIQLVFFDGEEAFGRWSSSDSVYGSRHLAKLWATTTIQREETGHIIFAPESTEDGSIDPPSRDSELIASNNLLKGIEALVLLDLLGAPAAPIAPQYQSTYDTVFKSILNVQSMLQNNALLVSSAQDGAYFVDRQVFPGNIDDDHRPFRDLGVPIAHIIPVPFPSVWHTANDNLDALDRGIVENLARIFRVVAFMQMGVPVETNSSS
eukprot:TRINITY_DN11829_c0_g1::TRINITY_DN11829_c0_g1_i1::g.16565::m.16565 TRINITY_DN11829_c0_g1::TRINITY_DN11829_c0_g1_i1::g.16565  ORF type:complete len:417 (-),score=32.70,sp/Q16769/QPCT_HUMAN/39.40/5e-59,Peptidase_M28/PF04389.12/1.5e-34 TRINITY_DN11829_c0_g1_i1:39-1289(-)